MKTPFELACMAYPEWIEVGKSWWRLVDGESASGMSEHKGKLILQEDREGCVQVFNHWGAYIMADQLNIQQPNGISRSSKSGS